MCADEVKTMTYTFLVQASDGQRVYTGHVSSRSPSTITMLLTTPYDVAGRVVKISVADVISEQRAA